MQIDYIDEGIVEFPTNPETGPTRLKINSLKSLIATEILPDHFPMEVLDNEYSWLIHPDNC